MATCDKWVSECHIKGQDQTYALQLLGIHRLNGLDQAGGLEGLASVDKTRASQEDAGAAGLVGVESSELGVGNSLRNVLLADGTLRNALEDLDSLLSTLADGGGGTGELDGQETGIRVGEAGGGNGETGSASSGLGEKAEAGSPLDAGLAAEEGSEDGDLGLGGAVAGTGEGDDDRVSGGVALSLLTTKVLAGLGLEGLAASRGSRNLLEELTNPLGDGLGGGAIGNEGDVGLGVDNISEAGDVLLVQVLLVGAGAGRVERRTETGVEGNGVGVVEGDGSDVVAELSLLGAEGSLDILVELVGYRYVNVVA